MANRLTGDDILVDRVGFGTTVYHRHDVCASAVLDALRQPGEPLKMSNKSSTRRVGNWVIKESRRDSLPEILRHVFHRNRCRRGWTAARFLSGRGVAVPQPHAFVEMGALGVTVGNALISEYLDGCHTVEHHAARLAENGAHNDEIVAFLSGLAEAINALCATGAYHADLSGKNIFTSDGTTFYFIDMDGVTLHRPYTDKIRFKNHVQLYDSFCDVWEDEFLEPFLGRMLLPSSDEGAWVAAVREAQSRRRARARAFQHAQGS